MLEFIKIAYLLSAPLLLICILAGQKQWKINSFRILAVMNLLLIGNSFFVSKQLLGLYYLAKELKIEFKPAGTDHWLMIRMAFLILLPFFSLHGWFRKNIIYSILLWVIVYSVYPMQTWSGYGLSYKIMSFVSLFCTVYALLWLLKKLPYQSSKA